MLRDPFFKSLRDQIRGLIIWIAGVAAYVALLILVYPSVRDSAADLQGYIDSLPQGFRDVFIGPGGGYASPNGYINMELFSWLGPIIFIAFAIGAANRALAGEEEDGTLSLLLAYPISRRSLVLRRFAAMVVTTTILAAGFWLSLLIATSLADMHVGAGPIAEVMLLYTLLGLAIGGVTLAVGAATGCKATGIAAGAAVGAAMYLLNTLGQMNDTIKPYRVLSLFHYSGGTTPLGRDLAATDIVVLGATTLVLLAVTLVLFERRDIKV